jgi:hypothetical protein
MYVTAPSWGTYKDVSEQWFQNKFDITLSLVTSNIQALPKFAFD